MESKPQTIKFNPDLEAEAGKLYRKYCDEKGIECRITAAANFCLGYMVVKEAATLKAQQGGWVKADQKPEHNVGVLVFIPGEDNHITSGMWDISNEWVLLDEYRTPEVEVTHWMPFPAFPEGYTHDMLSDEWVSTLKAIAKEELSKRPSPSEPEQKEVVAFAEWAGWEWRRVEGKSLWENQKTLDVINSKELYERFEKETTEQG
jgi:hypothetical protein